MEFFELFKTPWEFYDPERKYDVIISTVEESPRAEAQLVIIYSSQPTRFDHQTGFNIQSELILGVIGKDDVEIPLYTSLATVNGEGNPILYDRSGSKPVAVEHSGPNGKTLRAGYDLFNEVNYLLSKGQPVANATIPTLELHISLLREWIVAAGIPIVEIPPIPFKYGFFASLTHDVDFAGIRKHKFDHTMWGFVYRGLIGSLVRLVKGRINFKKLLINWAAVIKLPLVFAGISNDPWDHFDAYADIDEGFGSTFFIIPFNNQSGDNSGIRADNKRAAPYDIDDVRIQINKLTDLGLEIGLHGLDAWHSPEKAVQERLRIAIATGQKEIGIRMHWLFYNAQSPLILENAGFKYDATLGYNDTIGFFNGTSQVFRPFGATTLLELPLNIQDTSMFYTQRLNLGNKDAEQICRKLFKVVGRHGGILTLSWHERSLVPERLWGDFYLWLLGMLRTYNAWIGSASQVTEWFRRRRLIKFRECKLIDDRFEIQLNLEEAMKMFEPGMFFRLHIPNRYSGSVASGGHVDFIDTLWNGGASLTISIPGRETT